MYLNLNCLLCNLKQVLTVANLQSLDAARQEQIMREVLGYLHTTNYERSNPEVIKGTWDIITKHISNTDPYSKTKAYFNNELMQHAGRIRAIIDEADDRFNMALKIAITANLIDFAASHKFDEKLLIEKIAAVHTQVLPIDDSRSLFKKLKTAKTLLYLGDNCGEIVIDKIFIEYLKSVFPALTVYFGVRGEPIVNDVTLEDAKMVKMEDACEVISNGDGSLGTVIEKTSAEFRDVFYKADVIIAKGQGNYESLSEVDRDSIFFLFMAKCDTVASSLNVKNLSIVCAEYQPKSNLNA